MERIEFYTYEQELWCRRGDNPPEQITEDNREIVRDTHDTIREFYSAAYQKLSQRYIRSASNVQFYQFKIVDRFCRCNFGAIDNIPDIDAKGRFQFERISCPMRGECDMEGIVCNPEFNSHVSAAEDRVMEMYFNGHTKEQIAHRWSIAPTTIDNHRRNVYKRLGIHSLTEYIDYAHRNNLYLKK